MKDASAANPHTSNLRSHEPFLEWAAGSNDKFDGELGLGAFLTLRLVDQFCVSGFSSGPAAIEYQCAATRKFVEGISPQTDHSTMLREIAVVAEEALRVKNSRLLFSPLMAFAYRLEEDLRLSEASDVLDTALRLSDGRDAEEEVGVCLQRGRVLRNLGEFADARVAYERAGAIALTLGDRHSELLSRIGRGVVARFVGNLPESEQVLRGVIADSEALSDLDAEARASQDLAGTLYFAERVAEATPLAFRAFELFQNTADKARALSDTGAMLKELGHYSAAKQAFSLVLSHELRADVRARTELECLEVSALIGDRLAFERWRQALPQSWEKLPPDIEVDFELALGTGLSLFEEHERGEAHIEKAISLAEKSGMAERMFFAEQQLAEARERRAQPAPFSTTPSTGKDGATVLQDTIARLELLATSELG